MINERQARKFCKEDLSKIKNYDKAIADTTQTWVCHHRTEIWWNCTRKDLIDNEWYYNRKACELIFLTRAEHTRLHSMNRTEETLRKISEAKKGRTFSEEHRRKLSESHKGRSAWNKGKKGIYSEETRQKMSEAQKGKYHSDDTRRKISDSNKGKHHTEETKQKISEAHKKYWAKKRGEV